MVERAVDLMINSQALRDALKEVARDYYVSLDTREVVVDASYAPIYHTSRALEAYAERCGDETVKEDIKTLLQEVRERQGVGVKDAATLSSKGEITFALLWTLFYPGCKVVSKSFLGERQIAIVSGHSLHWSDKLELWLEYVDWYTAGFGVFSFLKEIARFKGSRQICSLDVFPLEHFRHADKHKKLPGAKSFFDTNAEYQASKVDSKSENAASSLISDLVERGRQFHSVCNINAEQRLREYSGQVYKEGYLQMRRDNMEVKHFPAFTSWS